MALLAARQPSAYTALLAARQPSAYTALPAARQPRLRPVPTALVPSLLVSHRPLRHSCTAALTRSTSPHKIHISAQDLHLRTRSTSPHKIYISAQDPHLRTISTSPHKIHISAQDLHLRKRSTSPPKIHIFVMLVVWNGAKPCGLGTRLVSFQLYRSGLRPLLGFCPTSRL